MAVYKPKKSPYWHYDFQFQGVRFHGSCGTAEKRAAKRIEARRRTEAAEGIHKRPMMAVKEAFGRYHHEVGQSCRTASDIEYQLANLMAFFGAETLLSEIDDSRLAEFVARRRGMCARHKKTMVSNATVNREVQLLRRVHRRANDVWRVDVGYMPAWGRHALSEPQERVRELSMAEETAFLAELREDLRPIVRFCILTGVRFMAAARLTWADIDYEVESLTVRAKSRRPGRSVHTVPITPAVRTVIADQKGKHAVYVFAYKCAKSRALRRKGEYYPLSKNGWRKEWARALKAAEVRDFRFHDTRHTAATRTLRGSGNLRATQVMLGHADIKTTAKYAHVTLGDVRTAMLAGESRNSPEENQETDDNELKIKAE